MTTLCSSLLCVLLVSCWPAQPQPPGGRQVDVPAQHLVADQMIKRAKAGCRSGAVPKPPSRGGLMV